MTPTGETFILLPEGLELAWSTVSPNERQISHSVLCGDERQVISILPPEIVGLSKIQQRPSSVNLAFRQVTKGSSHSNDRAAGWPRGRNRFLCKVVDYGK